MNGWKKPLALAAALLLAGCAPAQGSTVTLKTTEHYPFAPVTEVVEGRPDIYAVLKVYTSQYWQDIIAGLTDAGNDLGCNVYVGSSANESGWQVQQQLLQQAAENGADAVVLAPTDSITLCGTVSELMEQDIPVVLIDTILNGEDYSVCYMTDNLQAGEIAAAQLLNQLHAAGVAEDERAEVAVQIGSASSQTIVDRVAGFSKYWATHAPEAWVILDDVRNHDGDIEVAYEYALDYMETYPDLKGFLGCNNGATVAFARALLDTGRTDIALAGFDYGEETQALIESGQYHAATVVQRQYDMGYQGLTAALEQSKLHHTTVKFVDTGVEVIATETAGTAETAGQATPEEAAP